MSRNERGPIGPAAKVEFAATKSTARPRPLVSLGAISWRKAWSDAVDETGADVSDFAEALGCSDKRVYALLGSRGPTQAHLDSLRTHERTVAFARAYLRNMLAAIDRRSPERNALEQTLRMVLADAGERLTAAVAEGLSRRRGPA